MSVKRVTKKLRKFAQFSLKAGEVALVLACAGVWLLAEPGFLVKWLWAFAAGFIGLRSCRALLAPSLAETITRRIHPMFDPGVTHRNPVGVKGKKAIGERYLGHFQGHPLRVLIVHKLRKSWTGDLNPTPDSLMHIHLEFTTKFKLVVTVREEGNAPSRPKNADHIEAMLVAREKIRRGEAKRNDMAEVTTGFNPIDDALQILCNDPFSRVVQSESFIQLLRLLLTDLSFVRLEVGPDDDATRLTYLKINLLKEAAYHLRPGLGLVRENESMLALTDRDKMEDLFRALVKFKLEIQAQRDAGWTVRATEEIPVSASKVIEIHEEGPDVKTPTVSHLSISIKTGPRANSPQSAAVPETEASSPKSVTDGSGSSSPIPMTEISVQEMIEESSIQLDQEEEDDSKKKAS